MNQAAKSPFKQILSFILLFYCILLTGCRSKEQPVTLAETPFFDRPGINKLIDDNYTEVQKNGWAELRIPQSVHGITEDSFSPNALDAARKLIDAGYEAYIVGGAIRDLVMGTETMDFDISTNATNEEFSGILDDVSFHSIQSGLEFGYAHYPDEVIDVASCVNIPAAFYGISGVPDFNPDSLYSDNYLFDSFERDLTMNALYYDVKTGDLVDFHGGLHDIREGVLDTMTDSDTAIRSNPAVAIRALRFKARYGYVFSDRLEDAMQNHCAEYLKDLEAHTLAFNLDKFYPAGYARRCYDVLLDYDVFKTLYPALADLCDTKDYQSYARTATDWMDQWHDDGNLQDDRLAMAVLLWPALASKGNKEDLSQCISTLLDEENSIYFISDELRSHYQALFALEWTLTELPEEAQAKATVVLPEFENAYELLLIREASGEEGLKQAVEFWTEVRKNVAGSRTSD